MLKKLSLNLQERLKDRFRDHPLMQTCQKVFLHYMASMEQFDFTAEDLFVEVSEVIDSILGNPQGARQYLENLWDTLKIKLKRKAPTPPPQADLEMVCGVLYYVVAAIFCLHWREFYNTELVKMLRDTVERKRLFADDEEEIISNLCHHADALDDWINHYDDSDKWLSDEIDNVLNPEANAKPDEGTQNEPPTICLETVEKLLKPQFTINGSVFNSRGQLQKAVEEVDLEKNAQIGVLLAVCKEMGIVKPNTGNTDFVRILIGLGFIEYVNDEQIKRIAHGFSQKIKKLPPRHTQWSGDDKTLGDKLFGTLKQG